MSVPDEIAIGIVFKRRSPDGLEADSAAAAERMPDAELSTSSIETAIGALEARGFRVSGRSRSTLSIRGTPALFEQTFGAKVNWRSIPNTDSGPLLAVVEAVDGIGVPEEFRDVFGIVEIQPPNQYLASSAPLAHPPSVPGYYLNVLDDVRSLLGADKVHAKGTTGAGVRVAMIDSGFDHGHPFFTANGFASQRFPAHQASGYSADRDDYGHGTGESANLFSVAPGVEFIGVALGADAYGNSAASLVEGFQEALNHHPAVVSCSVKLQKPWNTLAQVIDDVCSEGVVVVASAGNGDCPFPGQLPAVIAAGGVYIAADGEKRASNYSSAYISTAYPGRSIPDCCGLVGELPRASYLMLPVPPGSGYDSKLAAPDKDGNVGDGTTGDDGWALFSGTSAAAPQLAGICALLLEKNPSLTPDNVKSILMSSCVPISKGSTFPMSEFGSQKASSAHPNTATGMGLVDAYAAWQKA